MQYTAKQGDIIFMDFDPQAGHEQKGRRPALVISNNSYNRYVRLAIVCPITNTKNNFPMHIALDERTTTTGFILCEHVKALDIYARNAELKEKLPNDILQEVLERIILSIE